MTNTVDWTGLGEISGFGGSYEDMCRGMVDIALEWFELNPDKDPRYGTLDNVYGLTKSLNEDMDELRTYILDKHGDCSSTQFQAVMSHAFFIRKNGLEKYYEVMKERARERERLDNKQEA